ncbi:tetratricopeptide repeat protein [Saltatorellus ferox]|uniref:tetratricopeptide repeat protein n=1 Tax=Saltatorellus ferox TaxID=2528018 RepID=UPI003AF392AA
MEPALEDTKGAVEPRPARTWIVAALIFGFAAAIRVVYVLALRDHPRFEAPAMDAGYHLAWAKALATGTEFRDGPLFRAPLYPGFLALLWKLTGGSLLGVRIVQALLGGVTAALTYRLGRRVASEAAGRVAGVMVAISWTMVAFDAELLIPVLLAPLLLVALELAVVWFDSTGDATPAPNLGPGFRRRFPQSLIVGTAFGLAAIARPNVLLFMPVLFGFSIWKSRRVMPALWLTLGTLLPILPVTVHNALEGDVSLIATQGGVNFWIGNNPASDGAAAIVPGTRDGWWEGYFDSIAMAEEAEGRDLRPTEVSAHYRSRAFDWMSAHPLDAFRHLAWKARLLFANVEIANNQDMRFVAFRTLPALRYSPARWGILLGLGSVGLVWLALRGPKERRAGVALLASFAVVYGFSIVLFFVNARFRLPLVPILSVGTGATLAGIVGALRSGRWVRVGALALPALLILTLSFIMPKGIVQSDANGLAELGRAELALGRPEQALEYLEEAIRANPASVQVRMALASAIVAAGQNPERALLLLEEARSLPRGADLVELEVQILDTRLSAGDTEGALRAARAALSKHPRDGALRFVVARAEAMSGNARGALDRFEALLADEPTNVAVARVIGQILAQIGPREDAIRAYERVLDLAPFATPEILREAEEQLRKLRVPAGR